MIVAAMNVRVRMRVHIICVRERGREEERDVKLQKG